MLVEMWWLIACEPGPAGRATGPPVPLAVLDAVSLERIRDDVDLLADEATGGRVPGSPGHAFARDWLAAEMAEAGLEPAGASFVAEFPLVLDRPRMGLDAAGQVYAVPSEQVGANLFGLRTGDDAALADEVVLLVAHYDHLGVDEAGDAYNGAFDDLTAVVALLELARTLDAHDVRFPRTLGFLFTDAEEDGLDGAEAWVADPTVPLPDVVVALSVDPLGRPVLQDFRSLFTFGAERSEGVARALDAVARWTTQPTHRINRTPVVTFGSDQDAFWDLSVPALWISSGGMSFYHTVDDTPETIDYRCVDEHLRTTALLAGELARAAERPVDRGSQVLSLADLEQAVDAIELALASTELTDEERAVGEDYRVRLDAAIRAGDPSTPDAMGAYTGVLLYVVFELTPAHPGPIPPPFPG